MQKRRASTLRDQPGADADPSRTPALFAGRYAIEGDLGQGGMGRVLRARDLKLQRSVAIKVLAPGLHGDEALRRFEQEARATCALNHANILDVHDIGTHQGSPFIVSELLHGVTLRERLRKGPLSVHEAAGYALQLAQGLSAAHEKGIVHRDLKPENLFLTQEGRLKILDFGIAKLVAPPATDQTLPSPQARTQEGAILGTVGYMSPEQVRGEPADQRSDVFSFGAIVYEMLAGRGAFDRNTTVETGYAILNDDPPPLGEGVPTTMRRLVERCLAKRPEDRFQSARALVDVLASAASGQAPAPRRDLRRWLSVALLLVALAVLGWMLRARGEAPGKSIAVLPFASLSAGEDSAWFADGIHGEVLNSLSRIADLKVISRTSVMQYKTGARNLKEIGEQLGVAAILEGSVQRAGNRVRIEVQLLDASKDHQLWADRYDRDLSDIFQIQSAVAEEIANKLRARLSPSERSAIERRPTGSREAWDLYLRGEAMRVSGKLDDWPGAERLYRKAIEVDPGFALAIAQLSRVLIEEWAQGVVPDTARQAESRGLADKAAELQPDLPEAHMALGASFYRAIPRDYAAAEREFRLALALAPGCAECIGSIGLIARRQGKWNDALAGFARSLELDPHSEVMLDTYAQTLEMMRRYADALIARDRQARISLHPERAVLRRRWIEYEMSGDARPLVELLAKMPPGAEDIGIVTLARFRIAMIERRFDDAIAALGSTAPEMIVSQFAKADMRGRALAAAGRKPEARAAFEEARAVYEELLRVRTNAVIMPMLLALVDAKLGRAELAHREAAQVLALLPEAKDAITGVLLSKLHAEILVVTGELDSALAETERLATVNGGFTRADLEMPVFDPLRPNPRFQRVLARLQGR